MGQRGELALRRKLLDPVDQHEGGGNPAAMDTIKPIAGSRLEIPGEPLGIDEETANAFGDPLVVQTLPVLVDVVQDGRGCHR